jgi:hypothetical protein
MNELRPIPSLDALAANPSLASTLGPAAANVLRRKAVVVLAALADEHPPNPPCDRPEALLDAKAAADILRVPATWLRDAARQGRVRCVHLGHYVRFRRQDLAAFIESNTAPQL